MTRRFVILSTQRSGSNWLEDRLDSHPDIDLLRSEPFRQTSDRSDSYNAYRGSSPASRVLSIVVPPIAKLLFLRRAERSSDGTFGFRLMYDQLRRNPSLFFWLARPGTTVIHLVRVNVLATHVSSLKAQQSGVFITRSDGPGSTPIHVPTGRLRRSLGIRSRRIRNHRRLLNWLRLDHVELTFEEQMMSTQRSDKAVADALGIRSVELTSDLRRQSAQRLDEEVANWATVCDVLLGTEWEPPAV